MHIPSDFKFDKNSKSLHLISRISEIGDFNYVTLLDVNSRKLKDTDLTPCSPQIILIEKNGEIVLNLKMAIYDTSRTIVPKGAPRGRSSRRRPIKYIELASNKLPRNQWVHCSICVQERMTREVDNSEIEGSYDVVPRNKNKNNTENSVSYEKTSVDLYLNGILDKSECMLGGRPPVHQNIIIGCIPSRLELLHKEQTECADNCRSDVERDRGGGKEGDIRGIEKRGDMGYVDKMHHNKNGNENENENGSDISNGPSIADVYWLPSTSISPPPSQSSQSSTHSTYTPSLTLSNSLSASATATSTSSSSTSSRYFGGIKPVVGVKTDPSLWGAIQPFEPPSALLESSKHALHAALAVLQSSVILLISSVTETPFSPSTSPSSSSTGAPQDCNSAEDVSDQIQNITLFALDIVTCGNDDVMNNCFRILRNLISNWNSFQSKNPKSAKSATEIFCGNPAIVQLIEILMIFVSILIDPSAAQYHVSTECQERSSKIQNKNAKSVTLQEKIESATLFENIQSVTLLWSQRIFAASVGLEKSLNAPGWSFLTSLNSNIFLSGVASIVTASLKAGIISSTFFLREYQSYRYNSDSKPDKTINQNTSKNENFDSIRQSKLHDARQLIASMCGGGGGPVPSLGWTMDPSEIRTLSHNSTPRSRESGFQFSFSALKGGVEEARGPWVQDSCDYTGSNLYRYPLLSYSESVPAQDHSPVLEIGEIFSAETVLGNSPNLSGKSGVNKLKESAFNCPNIHRLLSLLQRKVSTNPEKCPRKTSLLLNPESFSGHETEYSNDLGENRSNLEGESANIVDVSLQLSRLRCLLVQVTVAYNRNIMSKPSTTITSSISTSSASEMQAHQLQLEVLSDVIANSMTSLLSLASSDSVQGLSSILSGVKSADTAAIFGGIIQEGDVTLIENLYLRLWNVGRVQRTYGNDVTYPPGGEPVPTPVPISVPVPILDLPDVLTLSQSDTTQLSVGGHNNEADPNPCPNVKPGVWDGTGVGIDWYSGLKGEPSCPLVVLGGDVQITDGTKVRASLHFSSVAATPMTAINLEKMTGRWFYEVRAIHFFLFISFLIYRCYLSIIVYLMD